VCGFSAFSRREGGDKERGLEPDALLNWKTTRWPLSRKSHERTRFSYMTLKKAQLSRMIHAVVAYVSLTPLDWRYSQNQSTLVVTHQMQDTDPLLRRPQQFNTIDLPKPAISSPEISRITWESHTQINFSLLKLSVEEMLSHQDSNFSDNSSLVHTMYSLALWASCLITNTISFI
jgi:hypothetical protein